MAIRNDTSNDFVGPGGFGAPGAGSLEGWIQGRNGMVSPVFDRNGNIVGYQAGFPGQVSSAGAAPVAGGGVPLGPSTPANIAATQTAANTAPAGIAAPGTTAGSILGYVN